MFWKAYSPVCFVGGDGDGLQFWDKWFISLSLLKVLGQRSSSLLLPSIEGHSFHKSENLSGVLSHYGSSKAKIIIDPFPPPTQYISMGMKPASSHCEMPSVIRSGKLHKNAALGMLFSSLWQTDEPKGQNMVVHLSASDQESSWLVIENPHNCRGLAMTKPILVFLSFLAMLHEIHQIFPALYLLCRPAPPTPTWNPALVMHEPTMTNWNSEA